MRVAHVVDAGDAGAEKLAIRAEAAHRDAAEVDAVVAALAPDEPEASVVAARAVIGERDLERAVDRLRTGVREKHALEALRRDRREPLGKIEGERMTHLERRCEVHLRGLALDRLHDLRPAMAGVHAPEAGAGIEDLAAVGRPVVHALGAREQARRLLELPVRRERHPKSRLLQIGEIRSLIHVPSLLLAGKVGAGVFLGSVSLAAGILNAACMTY